MMKLIVYITIFLSIDSFACIQFPKKILLNNSIFPISEFSISGRSFSFIDPTDGTEASISCDSYEKRWVVNPINSIFDKYSQHRVTLRTNEDVLLLDIQKIRTCKNSGPTKECIPPETTSLSISLPPDHNGTVAGSIDLYCDANSDNGNQTITAIVRKNSKVVGRVSSTANLLVRGFATSSAATATLDMNSQNEQTLSFSGCGSQSNETNTNRGSK